MLLLYSYSATISCWTFLDISYFESQTIRGCIPSHVGRCHRASAIVFNCPTDTLLQNNLSCIFLRNTMSANNESLFHLYRQYKVCTPLALFELFVCSCQSASLIRPSQDSENHSTRKGRSANVCNITPEGRRLRAKEGSASIQEFLLVKRGQRGGKCQTRSFHQ